MPKNIEIEMTADSHIPSDLLTPSLGSNYGMDGFPDMEYGMGSINRVIDQEYQDPPALPSGLQKGSSLDMGFMEEQALPNLDWLDPSQIQDPMRLPHTPESIPELEEAWSKSGSNETEHQQDLSYARSKAGFGFGVEPSSKDKKAVAKALEKVVTHSMRRSIEGHDINSIIREASNAAGEEIGKISSVLSKVESEHGLAGNVFIRSSAYPGWGTGKWKDHAKAHAKGARYILVSDSDMRSASWIEEGRCVYTGKKAVLEVPWREALAHYRPRLEASGRRVASGDPAESLRSAFLSVPEKKKARGESLPTHKTPDQMISRSSALKQWKDHKPETVVIDRSKNDLKRLQTKAASIICRMERGNLIPTGERERILGSGMEPVEMVREATRVANQVKSGSYKGDNRTLAATSEFHNANSDRIQARQDSKTEMSKDSKRKKESDRIAGLVLGEVERGARGKHLQDFMLRNVPREYAKEVLGIVGPTLARTGALKETKREVRNFDGPTYKLAQRNVGGPGDTKVWEALKWAKDVLQDKEVEDDVAGSVVLAGQIKKAVKWVRKVMTEGTAGNDLDHMIGGRIAVSLLESSDSLIKKARKAHEGLSGFVYVDSEVYATESGTKGCEAGGLRHRANTIPYVLAMPRCATCTIARKLEDGSRKCGEYNKILLKPAKVAGPEMEKVKTANIKACNMDDAESTASLFSPSYDPDEFGLSNDVLEGIELEAPGNEKVIEVTFGDWKIW